MITGNYYFMDVHKGLKLACSNNFVQERLTTFSGYVGVFGVAGVLGVCGCSWSTTHFSDLFLRFANISAPTNCFANVIQYII